MSERKPGRKYERYRVRMPVAATWAREVRDLQTEDISLEGLFVRTDAALAERRLLKLRTKLLHDGSELTMHAMVAHSLPLDGAVSRVPGIGLQFYGNGRDTLERWGRHIQHVRDTLPGAADRTVFAFNVDRAPPEPIRRRYERVAAVLEVRVVTVDELLTIHSRDVSKGGMFVMADRACKVGEQLVLEVVHPETAAVFPLPSVVRREVRERGAGLAVEFLDLDDAARAAFWEFVSAGLQKPPDDDFDLVIDETDA